MLHEVSLLVERLGRETLARLGIAETTAVSVWKTLGGRRKASDVLALMAGKMAERDEVFDAKPWKLNCPNGVVDLRTGLLRPHRPSDRFRKVTGVAYDPDARSARWAKAWEAVDPDTAPWLRLRLGQAVTGTRPRDDRVLFLRGGGSNGKSVVVDAVSLALGDYALTVPPRVLIGAPSDHSTEMMTLQGVRLALLEEMPEHHLAGAMLKRLAGPREITARRIARDNVTFPVMFSLFVTTNYPLRVADTDHGTWRRITMVPFPFRYVAEPIEGERRRDHALKRWSESVADAGVLAWLVKAAVDCYRDMPGFETLPQSVELATNATRSENDVLGQFAEERLILDQGAVTAKSELFAAYQWWARDQGQKPLSAVTFTARFRETDLGQHVGESRSGGVRFWTGVRLRERSVLSVTP
jgi:putative DNA primase/helicase